MKMQFNELRARYERATAAERQQVLDLIPGNPLTDDQAVWEKAMREVFEAETTGRTIVGDDFETSELNLARRSPSPDRAIPEAPSAWRCSKCGQPAATKWDRITCFKCGLERSRPPPEKTDQGWNFVLPGTERSAQQAAKARGDKIRPKATQRHPAGLFEPQGARNLDLFS